MELEILEENTEQQKVKVLDDPEVYTIDNYLTDEECEHFIKLGKPNLQRALVSGESKGYVSQGRSGQNCWINHNTDEITRRVGEKIAKVVGVPLQNAEAFQIIYYGITQEYRQHYDGWDHNNSEKTLRNMKFGGQRLWTGLCYLNDVEEGGGTKFTKLNTEVAAKKGRLLVFKNTLDGTHVRHPLSEHAGMPVLKGEKYAFNLWFREYPRNKLYREFNPEYYVEADKAEEQASKVEEEQASKVEEIQVMDKTINFFNKDEGKSLHETKNIAVFDDVITEEEMNLLESKTTFDKSRSSDRKWFKKADIPSLVKKIESITEIPSEFYENINMVYYKAEHVHQGHLDAYDLNSETGKKYTKDLGQRLYTVTGFLSDGVVYDFETLKTKYESKRGSLLIYQNNIDNSVERDMQLRKHISNIVKINEEESENQGVILFHVFIRAKTRTNKYVHTFVKRHYITEQVNTRLLEQKKDEDNISSKKYTEKVNDDHIQFTTIKNDKLIDYLKELINSGLVKNKFINSTQTYHGKNIVDNKHKIRKDYTLTTKECSIIDMYIFKKTGLINYCNHRELWKILFYDGSNNSFRGPHKDWSNNARHRKLSIIMCLSKKDDYTGGELVFNDLNKKYKLDIGEVIIFNAKLTHEVLPVISGKRYVLTSFTFDDNGMDIKKVKNSHYKLLSPPNNNNNILNDGTSD